MTDLTAELRKHIDAFLDKRKELSIRSVAVRCGGPNSTLWNIYHGKSLPNFGQAISVLNVVSNSEETQRILSEFFADEAKSAVKVYQLQSRNLALSKELYRNHVKDPLTATIFALATTNTGITREKIKELYGQQGIQALDELIAEEIVSHDSEGKNIFNGTYSISNPEDLIDFVQTHIRNFDKSLLGTPGALLAEQTESVTFEAMKKIRKVLLTAYAEVEEIINDENQRGEFPVFVGYALHLLDKSALNSIPKIQR